MKQSIFHPHIQRESILCKNSLLLGMKNVTKYKDSLFLSKNFHIRRAFANLDDIFFILSTAAFFRLLNTKSLQSSRAK